MNTKVLIGYEISLLLILIFSYIFVDANFFYLKPLYTGYFILHREQSAVFFSLCILGLFFWYLFFLKRASQNRLLSEDVKKIVIITIATLLFSYPAMVSFDIFNYTTTSKVLFKYHENPYITMPVEFSSDTFLRYTRAANKTALYGPVWIILTAIPYALTNFGFLPILFSMKAMIASCYIGLGYVIGKLTRSVYSIAFFLLNPLVIIETLISSHNDVVMMFFALLSFYLIQKKKYLWATVFIVLSIFIKYVTLFIFPVFIFLIILSVNKRSINWERMFLISFFVMLIMFFASSFREEIYPWYFIWVLSFSAVLSKNKVIRYTSLAFSFSLLLRYLPVLYTGSYFGYTPVVKIMLTFIPIPLVFFIIYGGKKYGFFKNL